MTDPTIPAEVVQPPAVVVAKPVEQPRAWHWSIWATLIMPVLILGILVWQLAKLEPARWCGVATGAAKITDTNALPAIQSCFSLLSDMLSIYRTNTLALIVLVGICIVSIVVTTVKARVNVEAWGFRGGVGGDDPTRPQDGGPN